MSYISTLISRLTKQLFPNGRVFWLPFGGFFEKLNVSTGGDGTNRMGTSERLYNDTVSILDSLLPDNVNFTDGTIDPLNNDCNDWERRLGMIQYGITSASTPTRLERMAAIAQKMAYPGTVKPRQSAGYLESQLQAAGFNVYVYENLGNQSPADILGFPTGNAMLDAFQLGEVELGSTYEDDSISIAANYINAAADTDNWVPGANYYSTFFISGNPITTFADVPAVRQAEFRQLILKLKPLHMAGYLFINYI